MGKSEVAGIAEAAIGFMVGCKTKIFSSIFITNSRRSVIATVIYEQALIALECLSKYGINAKIVELPGHTNGSIGVDVEEKHLLVGDAMDNWVFPGMGHLYYNLEDIKKSYDKIKGLGPRTLYFGHGKPVKQ